MANMSYCAFENTFRALEQCIQLLGNEAEFGEKLSRSEYQYAQKIMKQFAEYSESLQEVVENRSVEAEHGARNYFQEILSAIPK